MTDVRRFRNFDQAWAERKSNPEPLVARVFGKDYELPASAPAGLTLEVLRLRREKGADATVPLDSIALMVEWLFSREQLNDWLAQGITFDQLCDVVAWAMDMYRGVSSGEPDAGEAIAPATGPSTGSGNRPTPS